MLLPDPWNYLLAFLASYLLGAIPFGWVLVKWIKGQDLQKIGSGNIGATNAARAIGRTGSLAVYALDFLKGYLPSACFVRFFNLTGENATTLHVLLGSTAILGHCFPVYLKFKGGKGVATTTGVLLGLDWVSLLLSGLVWVMSLFFFRLVSLSSMLLAVSLPFFVYFTGTEHAFDSRLPLNLFAIAVALLILFTHRTNMRRIWEGTEPKFGSKPSEG